MTNKWFLPEIYWHWKHSLCVGQHITCAFLWLQMHLLVLGTKDFVFHRQPYHLDLTKKSLTQNIICNTKPFFQKKCLATIHHWRDAACIKWAVLSVYCSVAMKVCFDTIFLRKQILKQRILGRRSRNGSYCQTTCRDTNKDSFTTEKHSKQLLIFPGIDSPAGFRESD